MRYLIVERQDGGCDYTIGCGVNIEFVEGDDINDAVRKYRESVEGEFDTYNPLRDEMAVNQVDIYELTGVAAEIDVDTWRRLLDEKVAANKQKKAANAEREQYERLKKKYG